MHTSHRKSTAHFLFAKGAIDLDSNQIIHIWQIIFSWLSGDLLTWTFIKTPARYKSVNYLFILRLKMQRKVDKTFLKSCKH